MMVGRSQLRSRYGQALEASVDVVFGVPLEWIILLFIVMIPFASHDILDRQILPMPGAKPFLLFSAYMLLVVLYNSTDHWEIPGMVSAFSLALVALFTVAVFRSIASGAIGVIDDVGVSRYLLSHYVKPLFFLFPLPIVAGYYHERRHVESVLEALVLAMSLLSLYLLYLYVFHLSPIQRQDFAEVRNYFGQFLKMHGNNIASYYTTTFPIVLAFVFARRSLFAVGALLLNLVAVALIYSRGAYASVLLATVLFLWLTKRTRWILLGAALGLLALPLLPRTIVARALTGLSGGSVDLAALSAGRLELLWTPLINELIASPGKLLLGLGRYGITVTDAFRAGRILPAGHPHNMYLELVIDVGILGAVVIGILFYRLLDYAASGQERITRAKRGIPGVRAWRQDDVFVGLVVSVIAYLLSGLTDRTLFPNHNNAYLWIVLACLVVLRRRERRLSHENR